MSNAILEELLAFVRDIESNWDCDVDAHKHGTPCRVCEASRLLKRAQALGGAGDKPIDAQTVLVLREMGMIPNPNKVYSTETLARAVKRLDFAIKLCDTADEMIRHCALDEEKGWDAGRVCHPTDTPEDPS